MKKIKMDIAKSKDLLIAKTNEDHNRQKPNPNDPNQNNRKLKVVAEEHADEDEVFNAENRTESFFHIATNLKCAQTGNKPSKIKSTESSTQRHLQGGKGSLLKGKKMSEIHQVINLATEVGHRKQMIVMPGINFLPLKSKQKILT